jgi:hypothetical protein
MTVYTMKAWLLLTAAFLVGALQCAAWHGELDSREQHLMQMAQSQGPQTAPLPGEAGQPRHPGLLQPPASIRIETPTTPIPAPPIGGEAAPVAPPKEPTASTGEATAGGGEKVPQVTSFPELTRGIGDSRTLLQE